MKTLADIPQEHRNLRYLESLLRYEEHVGVHTYHYCGCQMRQATRSRTCPNCIRGMIASLKAGSTYTGKQRKNYDHYTATDPDAESLGKPVDKVEPRGGVPRL